MKTKLSLKTPNAENSVIWLVLSDGREVLIRVYTGISIKAKHWSKKNDCVLSANPDATSINAYLKDLQKQVTDIYLSAKGLGIQPDSKFIKEKLELLKKIDEPAETVCTDLIKYIDIYIESKRNDVKEKTFSDYYVYKKRLVQYEASCKKKLLITDVNANFKTHFENFCLSLKYAPNTIARTIKFIKSLCLHAKAHGLATNYQMENIRVKFTKADSVYLTFEELDKIEKKDYTDEALDNVRDWLIISCYTGQRYSDFIRFSNSMIRVEKGKSLIEFTQQKTEKIMTVPLTQKVLTILQKRNGQFPSYVANGKYNDLIREVCKLAGLTEIVNGSKKQETEDDSKVYRKASGTFQKWELVSSHIGRRSFATNYYGSIPTTYLTYITGHSTETMFLHYIGKSNKDLAMEMSKYF